MTAAPKYAATHGDAVVLYDEAMHELASGEQPGALAALRREHPGLVVLGEQAREALVSLGMHPHGSESTGIGRARCTAQIYRDARAVFGLGASRKRGAS